MTKLSPAATIVLTRATERPDRLLEFHRKLPTAARHKMIDALLRDAMISETKGDYRLGDGARLIEDTATGLMLTTLAITDAGFRAMNQEPPAAAEPAKATKAKGRKPADPTPAKATKPTPAAAPRATLRTLAQAAVTAYDAYDDNHYAGKPLRDAIAALRTALATTEQKTRAGGLTKNQQALVDVCLRPQGATAKEMTEATGWPTIAARMTMQKIADRFGYILSEKPKSEGRGITFYLTAPLANAA